MTLARNLITIAALWVAPGLVHAQTAPAAEALFREGRTLIKQGKLQAGCDKLEASEKLDSSVGTLLNLGDCKEKLGRTASAWAAFRKAEAMAKRAGDDAKRQSEARKRAQKLELELPNLVIQVGKATPDLTITRDGEPVDAAAFNSPMPVDPGPHTIVAEAPGHKPFKTEVSVGKGGKRYVVVPSLDRLPEPPRPAAPVVVTPPPAAQPDVVITPAPTYITTESTWSGTRKAALVVGIAGAAAIGGGVYFGTRARDLEADADLRCPAVVCDDAEGLRLNSDAQDQAMRANIFFVAGGAAIAAATVMWFVGGPDEHTVLAPTIGSDRVGASLVGRF